MRSWLALALGIVALGATTEAGARSIIVAPLTPGGPINEEDLFQVGEALARTLRERGHDVLGPVEAVERIEERMPGCADSGGTACWCEGAARLARDTVIRGQVRRNATSGDVTFTLVAQDSRTTRAVVEIRREGRAPTRPELVALARTAAANLEEALPQPLRHARLRVESSPSGAKVFLNGAFVGKTPWSDEIPEGRTSVRVELPGHGGQTRDLDLAIGQSEQVAFSLPRLEADEDEPVRVLHRLDTLDFALAGVSATAVLTGLAVAIASVAPGDVCDGGRRDREGDCQFRERAGNLWPAAGLIAAGAIAGGVVLVRMLLGDRSAAPSVAAGGGTVGLGGRF